MKIIEPEKLEKIKKYLWYVQIFQNSLSLWTTVPLGIYDFDYANILWDFLLKQGYLTQDQLREWADPGKFFVLFQNKDNPANNLVDFLRRNGLYSWKNTLSYVSPLIEEVRRWDWWLAWEEIFYYGLISKIAKEDSPIADYWKPFKIRVSPIKSAESSLFIVSGPVAITDQQLLGQEEWQKEVNKTFVEPLFNLLGFEVTNIPFNELELRNLSIARKPLTNADFQQKSNEAFLTINSVFRLMDENRSFWEKDIRRFVPSLISGILNIFHNPYTSKQLETFLPPLNGDRDSLATKLRLSRPLEPSPQALKFSLSDHTAQKLVAQREKNRWLFQIKEVSSDFKTNTKAEEYVLEQFRRNEWHYQSRYEAYSMEKIVSLEGRLEKQFGVMGSSSEQGGDEEIYNVVTREIAELVSANSAGIYLYNFPDGYLDLKCLYYTNPDREDEGYDSPWIKSMKDIMKEAGSDKDKREQSISYRAYKKNLIRFCRAFNPETKESVPSDEPILPQAQGFKSPRCCIAAPLRVHGKTYGVLEVGGLWPYQFRWYNRFLVLRLAETVSPLFYQRDTLYRLGQLSRVALRLESDLRKTYSQIVKEICSILLSSAGCLWMPDRSRPNLFAPVGWSGRPDLEELLLKSPKAVLCNRRRPGELISRAIPSTSTFLPISIEEVLKKDPAWKDRKEDRKWIAREVKNIILIPITLPAISDPLAILELYYKKDEDPLNDQWKPICGYVAHHLAVLIQAVLTQGELREHMVHIIGHELKQKVDAVVERSEGLGVQIISVLRKIDNIKRQDQSKALEDLSAWLDAVRVRKRVELLTGDLRHYIKSTHQLIEFLQDENKWATTGYHPLIHHRSLDILKAPFEKVNFRKLFNEVFRKYWNIIKEKRLLDTVYNGPMEGPYIKIHSENLRDILDNLASNAFKYATPRSQVKAKVQITEYSFVFSLTNEALCLEEDEEQFTIFNEGIRGSNAGDVPGQGMGLFIARSYSELYGGGLTLSSMSPINEQRGGCLFTFELSFPRTMVSD